MSRVDCRKSHGNESHRFLTDTYATSVGILYKIDHQHVWTTDRRDLMTLTVVKRSHDRLDMSPDYVDKSLADIDKMKMSLNKTMMNPGAERGRSFSGEE